MIKKTILALTVFLLSSNLGFCFADKDIVNRLEQAQYGTVFVGESITKRLSRLERDIFGRTFNQTSSQRIDRLKQQLNLSYNESGFTSKEPPIEYSNVQYPSIDKIERMIYGNSTPNDNIHQRLERLEKYAFNKTYQNNSLHDRTTRLNKKFKTASIEVYQDPRAFRPETTTSYESDAVYEKLATLEYNFLQTTFRQDPASVRVERLEKAVLGSIQQGDLNSRMNTLSQALATRPMSNGQDYYHNKYENWGDDFFNDGFSIKNGIKGMWRSIAGSRSGTMGKSTTTADGYPLSESEFFETRESDMGCSVKILPY